MNRNQKIDLIFIIVAFLLGSIYCIGIFYLGRDIGYTDQVIGGFVFLAVIFVFIHYKPIGGWKN